MRLVADCQRWDRSCRPQGQLGYFDSSAWGEGPREGEIYSVEGERDSVSDELDLALLGTGEGEGGTRTRSWKRKREKKLGKNKPGKELILKVTLFGSSSPLPHPKTQALGHRVW